VTVTAQVAVMPKYDMAVIVAVPADTAVTMPPLTVATDALLVSHVMLWHVPVGKTVAVKVSVRPTASVSDVLLIVTPVSLGYT